MSIFSFSINQDIKFGADSAQCLPEMIKKLRVNKILIISDPILKKIGAVDKIDDLVKKAGAETVSFTDVEANPSVETVNEAVKCYEENGAQAIVAIGGGSPIDTAKAVGIVVKHGGGVTDYEGIDKVPGDIVPLVAIPTTAGTGSEVTTFAVITDHSRNYKLTIGSAKLLPAHVILDPIFLASCPAGVAAASGMDAIVHALEAYINKACNPFIECMAGKAMDLLGKNIRNFVADRTNVEAAEAMLLGSAFAGIAFNFGRLGNIHAMAHPLGGFFNIPHGVANAVLLPTCLEFNALADQGKYQKIFDYVSLNKSKDDFEPMMLVEEIKKLNKQLGIPEKLSEYGVSEDKVTEMAIDAMKSGNIKVNPRFTTQEDIENLYLKAL